MKKREIREFEKVKRKIYLLFACQNFVLFKTFTTNSTVIQLENEGKIYFSCLMIKLLQKHVLDVYQTLNVATYLEIGVLLT